MVFGINNNEAEQVEVPLFYNQAVSIFTILSLMLKAR